MDGQGYSRVDLLVLTRTGGSSVRFLNLPLWGSSIMLSRTYLHLSRPCF